MSGAGTPAQRRALGTWPSIALVAGSMLGIGIFIAPPVVAANLSTPGQFLILWLAGGLAALFGALSVAELGAMMPRSGGDYTYLREAYGPGFAFAAGWLLLLAIFPGSLATMAVGAATFQLPILLGDGFSAPVEALGLPIEPHTFWAAAIVLFLTGLNHVGVVVSGRFQLGIISIPVLVLVTVSLVVILDTGVASEVARGHGLKNGVGTNLALAYLPVYFAYSGWNAAIFVGGEIRDPGRNLPRALVGGTAIVLLLYLLLCTGFLSVFGIDQLADVGEAGTAAARQTFGESGEVVVTALILLAMLGAINGTVMTGSRIAFAMAEHGHTPERAGTLHRRFGTPVTALWAQAALTMVLLATRGFEELMNYASAAMLITGTLTVLSVIVLRRKLPAQERPYRTWLYPLPPILYAGSSLLVLAFLVRDGDPSVFMCVGWFVLALIVHHVALRNRGPGDSATLSSA